MIKILISNLFKISPTNQLNVLTHDTHIVDAMRLRILSELTLERIHLVEISMLMDKNEMAIVDV